MQTAKLILIAIPLSTLVIILLGISALLDQPETSCQSSYAAWYASANGAGIDSLTQNIDWSK